MTERKMEDAVFYQLWKVKLFKDKSIWAYILICNMLRLVEKKNMSFGYIIKELINM